MMNQSLCILSPQLGFNLTLGGGLYDYEQLAALARLGHKVHVIMPRANRRVSTLPPGIHLEWIRGRAIRHPFTWTLIFLYPLLSASRRLRPDLIRIHTPFSLGLAGLIVKKIMRIPVIAIVHHLGDPLPAGRWVERRLFPLFDGIVCPSKATAQAIREIAPALESHRICWAYPGLGLRLVPGQSAPEQSCGPVTMPDVPIFAFVGALIPRKNLAWLIDVFRLYCLEGHSGQLVIAGQGPEELDLRALVASHALEGRVSILGKVTDEQRLVLYRSATAFLFPSLMEGFGLAAAEAMACGTPAIVSNIGALPEVVRNGETGFVLPIDQGPRPWIEAMRRLVSDRQLRDHMGHMGRLDVERRFNWDSAACQVAEFFQQVVDNHRTRTNQ